MTPIEEDELDFLAPDDEETPPETPVVPPPPAPVAPPPAPPAPPAPVPAPAPVAVAPEKDEFEDDPYAKSIREAAEKRAQAMAEQQMNAMYGMMAPIVQQNAISRIAEEGNVPKEAVPFLREIVADIPAHLLANIDAKTLKTLASAAIGRAYQEKKIASEPEAEIVPVAPVGSTGGSGALTASQKAYAKDYYEVSGVKPTRKQLLEWGIQ